jgi:hypothetical protein
MQFKAMTRKSLSNPSLVKDIDPPGPALGDLTSDPRWLLAQRVAQSELFRHSPRLRGFLLFIVERTLRNCADELVEYEIGTQAFDRTADFNPADDSIVCSSARLLRAKLKEYFAGEGRDEPLLIEVPKGAYVPEFVPRPPAEAPGLDEVLIPPAARRPVAIYALCAACVVLLAACAFLGASLWKYRAVPVATRASSVPPSNLIFSIFQPGAELNLVYDDSAQIIARDLRPSNLVLDDYIRYKEQKPTASS